jgi:hypothetical protein
MPVIELKFGSGARLRISGTFDPDVISALMKAMPRRWADQPAIVFEE